MNQPTLTSPTRAIEARAIDIIRGLAMDAPHAARSGHQGTAMALAPLAHVLWTRIMNYDPSDPAWPDRDRFVLSAGHASILLYSMLYLTGYGLELADLEDFRQWGSRTPGHPEVGHTSGVEVTTGPLGQGFANAVGLAMAERSLRARLGDDICNHFTYVICSDGDLSEGISHESRVARRAPRPRSADRDLRRQPHLDRRPDRVGIVRRCRQTLPGVRVARASSRRDRQRLRCHRSGDTAGDGCRRSSLAHRVAQPHRVSRLLMPSTRPRRTAIHSSTKRLLRQSG